MSLGKRLFIGEAAAAAPSGTSDILDVFGDGNCLALYTLDYDASETGGNYDGTLWDNVDFGVDGQMNWGASFNDGYIQTSLSIGNTTDFTISFWVKDVTQSNFGSYQYKSVLQDYNGNYLGLLYDKSIGKIVLIVHDGSTQLGIVKTSVLDDDWHHIVFTQDVNLETKVYVDGSLQTSETLSHTSMTQRRVINFGTGLYIGANPANTGSDVRYRGKLDQVRIFNRAISQNEVDTLYAETATTYTPTTDTLNYQGTNTAYYKLDGNALDETSNYNAENEIDITYEFGRYGTAAVFNSTSSYITANSSMFGTGDGVANLWSISLWFKTVGSATASRVLVGTKGGSTQPGFILFMISGGQIRYYEGNTSTNSQQLTTTASYDDGNWHNVVMTRSGTTDVFTMYIDGAEVIAPTTMTNPHTSHYFNLHIGRYPASIALFWYGSIDQIRIFDSALDATAVQNLYNEKQAYITKNASDPFGDGDEEAFYKFDNNTNDSTGSYNMTNRNITFSADSAIGTHSGEFNGTSSEGVISSTTTTPVDFSAEDFTISFWAKVDNFTNTGYLLSKWGSSSANDRAIIASIRPTGYEDFNVYEHNGYTYYEMTHSQSLEADRWYHFAYTRNGSTGTLYVDGVGESFARNNTIKQTSQDIFIGNAREDTSVFFDGHIDSMRFFSRCLDGDEVFKLYAEVIN